MTTTWRNELYKAFKETGDNFSTMKTTLSDEELILEFDDSYGEPKGLSFTAWGDKYVYFPLVYDGAEFVGYAPREVCDIKTDHLGCY